MAKSESVSFAYLLPCLIEGFMFIAIKYAKHVIKFFTYPLLSSCNFVGFPDNFIRVRA